MTSVPSCEGLAYLLGRDTHGIDSMDDKCAIPDDPCHTTPGPSVKRRG